MAKCTYIDGIASSQAIDTAGEIVDIAGLDCSMLIGGAFNWEHKSDIPAQLVGKVLDYKKIFSQKDCETDRHKHYWSKIGIPFLYVMGRLFDDDADKVSAKEVAGLFRDDAAHPNEPKMVGFSIEGSKINKTGMTITHSIARKVTITNTNANKTCEANILSSTKAKSKDTLESIFKGEITLFNPESKYLEFLQKKEENMEKDVGSSGGAFIGDSLAMSELAKSAGPSWSHTGGGNFSHPEHGTVSVIKHPSGQFHVKHNGAMAGMGGVKGVFSNAKQAGAHAGQYMHAVSQRKVMAPSMHNVSSNPTLGKSIEPLMKPYTSEAQRRWAHTSAGKEALGGEAAVHEWDEATKGKKLPEKVMKKALEAGSGMGAPSTLTQGAALAKEGRIGTLTPAKSDQPQKPKISSSVRIGLGHGSSVSMSTRGTSGGSMMVMNEKTKSEWLGRAEEAYKTWEKREEFENFMKSKMPHLTKGEIKAIGQTLALKKSINAENKLNKMFSSYFGKHDIPTSRNESNEKINKTTDILMAKEKK